MLTTDMYLGNGIPVKDVDKRLNDDVGELVKKGWRVLNDYDHPAVGRVVELVK